MPKHKSGAELLPWMSARPNNKEGRFLQVGNSLLLSKAYQALSGSAKNVYLCMSMESGKRRDFQFTHGAALKKYGIANTTLDRALKELISKGFIMIVQRGSLNFPSIYGFCFDWKLKPLPQTGEGYKKYSPQNGDCLPLCTD